MKQTSSLVPRLATPVNEVKKKMCATTEPGYRTHGEQAVFEGLDIVEGRVEAKSWPVDDCSHTALPGDSLPDGWVVIP